MRRRPRASAVCEKYFNFRTHKILFRCAVTSVKEEIPLHITKKQAVLCVKLFFAAAVFTAILLCPLPSGLTREAMLFLAIFITAIYCMTVNLMKDYLILLLALTMTVLLDASSFSSAFSAFSGTTVWLIIGAFGIGAAVAKCGLMNRIAFHLLKPFPKSFSGQVLALFTLGTVLSPLVPSSSAKTSLLTPFAKTLSDENGYTYESPGAVGFFAASILPVLCTACAFYSSSALVLIALGLIPAEYSSKIHWIDWFLYSLVWFAVVSAALYFLVIKLYRPKEKTLLTDEFIERRLKSLGPMSANEKKASVLLVITLLAWITESLHGISTTIVALLALVMYHAAGILDSKTFRTGVAWENIIMIGCIISTSNLFTSLGISAWLSDVLYPYIKFVISNIYVFIPLLCILVYIGRTVIISQVASLTIFYVVFGTASIAAGIHPWIIIFVLKTAGCVFNFPFQNTTFLSAYGGAGSALAEHRDIRILSIAYMGINIAALLISTLWWQLLGLM